MDKIEQSKKQLLARKQECATAMHSVSMRAFSFPEFNQPFPNQPNRHFSAKLERPSVSQVNVRKLYVLVQSGELSLDDFFASISAPIKKVQEYLDIEQMERVTDMVDGKLDLIIEEV